MKKIILFLMLLPVVAFSAIDECKTDVYFANGILTSREVAKENAFELLKPAIKNLYSTSSEYKQHIGKIDYAYNKTKGFWFDGIETYLQKFGLQSLVDLMNDTAHKADLKIQIDAYKTNIKLGHRVLVVAHSQGNLFTNEVYKKLLGHATDWWMTRYFKVVSIASPMCFKITPSTPGISWDNDVVPNMVGLCSAFNVENNVRKVSWEFYDGTPRVARPNHNYIYKHQVGEVYENSWKGIEEGNDENVHAFTFYMGKGLKEGDKNKPNHDEIYLNPFDDKNITNDTAKDLIMTTIKNQIDELEKLSSQWTTDQEFDKNTCDYKITLKHQYDPSIEIGEKVYPFNASKKLYQAKNKDGVYEYVKASCGGKNILDQWDGKKDNECLMIDNAEEEKIGLGETIKFYAYFLFEYDNDGYTWPYISSSFIADTYSTEITSLAQWREIRPNQRECRTQSGIAGGSNSGYFYFNSDVTVKRIEDIHIFGGHYNLQPYKYTIKCILNKNQKNLDDIEKIEKGKVTYEEFHGSNGFASRDGIYFNKLYLIEYFIHTK